MTGGRFSNLEFDSPRADAPGDEIDIRARRRPVAEFGTREKDADYHMQQAVEHELAGNVNEALRSYSAALGENAQLLDAWVGQLWILLEQEEYPEVELWSKKALGYFPDNPCILSVCSLALLRMGMVVDAKEMNDRALEREGDFDIVWITRGEIMAKSRGAAEQCYHHALRATQNEELTLLRIGAACYRNKRYQLGLQHLQQLTAQGIDSAKAWVLLGMTQDKLGFPKTAKFSIQQGIDMQPHNQEFRNALSQVSNGFFRRLMSIFKG